MTESLNDNSIGYYNFTNISSAAHEVYNKVFSGYMDYCEPRCCCFLTVVSVYFYMMEKNGYEFLFIMFFSSYISPHTHFFSLFGDHNRMLICMVALTDILLQQIQLCSTQPYAHSHKVKHLQHLIIFLFPH